MSVTSAKPSDLKAFVKDGAVNRAGCVELLNEAGASTNVVRAASNWAPPTSALAKCVTLLEIMNANERFVSVVHNAVVAADKSGGVPVDDRQIAKGLSDGGLLDRPGVITSECKALQGIPQTSGFVDDPVCAANGNFVHGDLDLMFLGFSACLNLARIYNSLAHARLGAFGRGWSSSLDMSLHTDDRGLVNVALADGAVV